jgi:hypothetical protein
MTRLESGGLPYSSTRLAFQAASSSRRHRLVPRAAKALASVGYRAQQRQWWRRRERPHSPTREKNCLQGNFSFVPELCGRTRARWAIQKSIGVRPRMPGIGEHRRGSHRHARNLWRVWVTEPFRLGPACPRSWPSTARLAATPRRRRTDELPLVRDLEGRRPR